MDINPAKTAATSASEPTKKRIIPIGLKSGEHTMRDEQKTKAELIEELSTLRSRVEQLEQAGIEDESDQTFRMVFDNAPDGMLLADAETGKFCMCNNAVCQMLGFDCEEITKLRVSDIHPAEHLPYAIEQFEKQCRGELSLGKNIPVKRKDGSVFYADISSSPTTLDGRKYLMGIYRDVTERRLAEQALKASEKKYRFLFDSVPTGIGISDLKGNVLDVNRTTEQMMGYSLDELKSMNVTETYANPEDRLKLMEVLKKHGRIRDLEHRLRTKDGGERFVLMNVDVIERDGKEVLLATSRDITERKREEERQTLRFQILETFHQQEPLTDLCCRMIFLIKEYLSCEAVALRMKVGDDYPYFVNDGFPQEFIESENYLCRHDEKGDCLRNSHGRPVLACMCGLVISAQFSQNSPFFTEGGTFWINSTTSQPASTTMEDKAGSMRNTCNQYGYESVALIPIELNGDNVGLLQINAKRENLFTLGTIQFLEELGHLIGIAIERKQGEQALQESEDKFREITERGFDVVVTADLNGTLTYASPSVIRIFGYTPDEMVGKSAMQFIPESSLPELKRNFKEIADGRSLEDREIEICRKDGTIAVVELNGAPISKDGRIIGAMASARDITVRRRAENALRESEEKYRTLVESAGESIASINKNGVFLFMNKIAAERLGGKPDDYVGKTMWDLFPKEVADKQISDVRKVIETEKEITSVAPTELQGQLRWYNTTVEPLRDGSGKVVSVMVIARDIHDVKQAGEELQKYREKMARAEQLASLGTLSATAAHELTQPLTVVRLSLDNLLDDLKAMSAPETVIRKLQNSLVEVSNLTSIIDRFRSFARKSSERTVEQIDLNSVAENITRLLNESSRQARVALQLKDMDKLPPVSMNERDSEQLFFALVQNAIHAADGKKDRRLVISGLVKDDCIELRFSDDCGGIAPEDLVNVFEPFYTTKPPGQGTGLGLCIVQDIAIRAGGKVSVESELGRGTTFLVTLPAYEAGIS